MLGGAQADRGSARVQPAGWALLSSGDRVRVEKTLTSLGVPFSRHDVTEKQSPLDATVTPCFDVVRPLGVVDAQQ